MVVYVYSRSTPIGVPITSEPHHIERFDSLAEAWDVVRSKWMHYQYHIHSIYEAGTGKTFSRSEIDEEIARRQGAP